MGDPKMTRLVIRKSGGANIVTLPKAVLKTLGLHTDSTVELSLENNKIVLAPLNEKMTLEDLLAGSPKKRLTLKKEDREWVNAKSVGKEEI